MNLRLTVLRMAGEGNCLSSVSDGGIFVLEMLNLQVILPMYVLN
jgi:hypothetical protein